MKKILLALIFFSGKMGISQTAVTNTGILYVSGSSTILFAANDLTNNAGSALTNNGQLYVQGNLTNNQVSMPVGTGALYLNGGSAQAVSGSQPFKTFNFISNNAGGITLNNNLSISGAHTFTSGIITTSATPNYLVYENGSSYSGDGDTRHVNGWVKKIGAANFIFPVGDGTIERTAAISSLSASSEFNAKYLTVTPFSNLMLLPIHDVNEPEYWSITKASGGTASVTLNWDYNKVYFPNWIVPDIRVVGYNGSQWVTQGGTASGTAATTGTITSGSISSFNLFALGSQSYILPLNLVSFTAKRPADFTQLAWVTENELNVSRYVAERSDDNAYFYSIDELKARNSGNPEKYFSRDDKPVNNIAYYRLRCIDNDGKQKLSQVVSVTDISISNTLTLRSNPVTDQVILLAHGSLKGSFDYRVTSMNGQLIKQGKINILNGGQYILPLNENIKAGTYLLKVSDRVQSFTFKLIKN